MKDFLFDKVVYKYRSYDSIKMLLGTKTLYFNCPSQFNDPFEFSTKLLSLNASKEFARQQFGRSDNVHLQNYSRRDRRNMINKVNKDLYHKSAIQTLNSKRDSYGVFCASEVFDSTLMWSHYADNHRGFCVGIKFPNTKEFLNNFIDKLQVISLQVNYRDEIEPMPCFKNNEFFPNEVLRYWFSTKSKVWEYEKELRLVRYSGNGPIEISGDWISEIYFGLSTPDSQVKEIITMAKAININCKFYKMRFKKDSFQLTNEQIFPS